MPLTNEAFESKFNKLIDDMAVIKTTITEVNTKFSDLKSEIDKLNQDNKKMEMHIQTLSQENKILKQTVSSLEQYSRKNNLIINGIPYCKGENVRSIVKAIADKLKIAMYDYNIAACHRLPARKVNNQSIILCLNDSDVKSSILNAIKRNKIYCNDIGIDDKNQILIGEHLTNDTLELLRSTKILKIQGKVEFVWCKDGKIFIRENSESRAIKINDQEHLMMISNQFEEVEQLGAEVEEEDEEPSAKELASLNMKNPEGRVT